MKSQRSETSSSSSSSATSASPPAQASGSGGLGNSDIVAMLGAATSVPYQAELEASFGTDLSGVEVYTGLGDLLRNRGLEGVALGGQTVLFADASPSKEIVAHELAHVVQAGVGAAPTGSTTSAGDATEQEAEGAAAAASAGGNAEVSERSGAPVAGDTGGAMLGGLIGGFVGGIPGAIIGGLIGDSMTTAPTPEEEMEAFRARTFAPLLNHQPSSGGMFDVAFNARTGALTVTLKVGYTFVNGTAANVTPGFRPEEFVWTPEQQAEWRTNYQAMVSSQWSGQHTFQSTKTGWTMPINCVVQVVQNDAAPHFMLTVEKYPDDADMQVSSICPPGTAHGAADTCPATTDTHGTGAMDSNDLRREAKLNAGNSVHAVPFGKGNTVLRGAGATKVAEIATALTAAPGAHASLTGRASSDSPAGLTAAEGAIRNMDLARARSQAVKGGLVAGGIAANDVMVENVGAAGAGAGAEWCRVDVVGGTRETQNPGLHETGHMFGLGDEYPTTANPVGSAVRSTYDAILRDQLGRVVTRDRTESAMSSGSTVESWHYVTFLEALKQISGVPEWSI